MGSPLKDLYSPSFYNRLSAILEQTVPSFDKKKFTALIFDKDFDNKELKDRMKHTAIVLHEFMPESFAKAVPILKRTIDKLRKEQFGEDGLAFMFLPEYISAFGLNDYENAVKALEFTTQFVSCEFAIRPFILKYGNKMIAQMAAWSFHEDHKVRRFASEGTRPRLPWALALPELKKDPTPILPILEQLKNDPSEWVRRSVANSINDIAKDNPEIVLQLAAKWKGISKETDAIIKHGSRTLLKQGHTEILKHYGLEGHKIELAQFKITTPKVKIGGNLDFSFSITNNHTAGQTVRLEYALYYKRQNGVPSKKVFKISERIYAPNEQASIQRKQSFKLITTRKFYAGPHQLSIIVNGQEKEIRQFELTE